MKNIGIYVAHTSGQNNQTINNPLFVNVRGGAINDNRKNITMLGDDTGDNISELNKNFSEYSVIYWAWKNNDCDYYGLCHYRRFLSFSKRKFAQEGFQVVMPSLSHACIHAAGLDDEQLMRREIEKYDMIIPKDHDVILDECKDYRMRSSKQFWLKYHASYLKPSEFDLMLDLIKKHNPEYYKDAVSYMKGTRFRGFNCFVMKKELFIEFCEYAFPILFEFHEKSDRRWNSTLTNRNVGYVGEWLYSIWVENKIKSGKYKIKETQLIGFADTNVQEQLEPAFAENYVPVVMTVDGWNIHEAAVTMQSIIENASPKTNLDFIILHQSNSFDKWQNYLLSSQIKALQTIADSHLNVSIRDYDPKGDIGKIELGKHIKVDNEELYYASLLPWILKKYKKVAYVNEAMLANADLCSLLAENLDGNTVGAAIDLYYVAEINGFARGAYDRQCKKMKLANHFDYYSADLFVIDLEKARSKYDKKEMINKLCASNADSISELFNVAYNTDIYRIDQSWNAVTPLEFDYYAIQEYMPECYKKGDSDYKFISRRTIHGISMNLQLNVIKEYLQYAKNTPFYEEVLMRTIENNRYDFRKVRYDYKNSYSGSVRTKDQEFADRYFPLGSKRRIVVDTILPQDSVRQQKIKNIIAKSIKEKK